MLEYAVDDWFDVVTVYSVFHTQRTESPIDVRNWALGLICRLLTAGLIRPGDIVGGEFWVWLGIASDWLGRIAQDWLSREDPLLHFGEVAWFDITEEGEVRAGQLGIES